MTPTSFQTILSDPTRHKEFMANVNAYKRGEGPALVQVREHKLALIPDENKVMRQV